MKIHELLIISCKTEKIMAFSFANIDVLITIKYLLVYFSDLLFYGDKKTWHIYEKTTGKPIKWIICCLPVLLKVFFDKKTI